MVRAGLEETGVQPCDAAMIDDIVHAGAMAGRSGLFALGVGWGYQAETDLIHAGAETVVKPPAGTIGALDELWGVPRD
jgi:phosphoglycolate phosphatase-like HAD superfamily hydrolase